MSDFIEEFYFGNIEPQEICTEHSLELKKKLDLLTETEEQLKEQNQLEWVQRMNNIRHRATEIVNAELIYV